MEDGRYDAFISYSHARDIALAEALQSELERFAGRWYRPRVLRVFRDRTDLAAAPALWPTIEQALAASDWFILMASPESARSEWVGREVAWWTANRSPDRILIALTGGDGLAGSVPGSLVLREEPHWIDLRDLPPKPTLGDMVAEFAAPIQGRSKASLVGAHLRERARVRRLVRSVIAVLSVLLLGVTVTAFVAVRQRDEANRQRAAAEEQARIAGSRALAALATSYEPTQADRSLLLAAHSYRLQPNRQSREALRNTLLRRTDVVRYLRTGAEPVDAVAISPDNRIVTVATGTSVRSWRLADGTPYGVELPIDGGRRPELAYSPDGRLLAIGGDSLIVAPTGGGAAPLVLGRGGQGVSALRFSADGRRLAVGTCPSSEVCGIVEVWDSRSGRRLNSGRVFTRGAVSSVAFSADGRTVAAGGALGDVTLIDLVERTLHPLTTTVKHPDAVESVAFSGRALVSASGTETPVPDDPAGPASPRVLTWRLGGSGPPTATRTLPLQSAGDRVVTIDLGPGGRRAVTVGDDRTLRIYDTATGAQRGALTGHLAAVEALAVSADGTVLVSGDQAGTVLVWRLPPARVLPEPLISRVLDDGAIVTGAAFSPDGRRLAAGDLDSVGIWDPDTGARLARYTLPPHHGVKSVAFSPDGNTVAVVGLDGEVLSTGVYKTMWGSVVLLDARSGRPRRAPVKVGGFVSGGVFTADGTLAVLGVGNVVLLDPATGGERGRIAVGDDAKVLAASPDGRRLATGGDEVVRLWNLPGGGRHGSDVRLAASALAFSPDGRTLAAGSEAINLVDVATTVPLGAPLAGHPGRGVASLAFNGDGTTLASGSKSADGEGAGDLMLWDVGRREALMGSFPGQKAEVSALTVASGAGGFRLAAAHETGVTLWQADTESWIRTACQIAARELTPQEWAEAVGGALPFEPACPGR